MGKQVVRAKHSRRLGENLTGQEKIRKILAKRNYPPGLHGPLGRGRISEYGEQLREKQRTRYIYGLREQQLRKYFKTALRTKTNTGEELVRQLERRLDNVVFRLGFAATRAQSRQLVGHHHVLVNGKINNIPSYQVRTGDKISLKEKSKNLQLIKDSLAHKKEEDLPDWLSFESQELTAQVVNLPQTQNLNVGLNPRLIIEFYSR